MRYFTSDQHYDHYNIIGYCGRPYETLWDMQEDLIRRHNQIVKPSDEVIHVGDFSLNEKTVPKVLPRLNGTHRLVPGNHDRCFEPKDRQGKARDRYLSYGFSSINQRLDLDLAGTKIVVSHIPLRNKTDPADPRTLEPEDLGTSTLVHGHVHEKWKTKHLGNILMVNVGVDVWDYKPVSEEEILALLAI